MNRVTKAQKILRIAEPIPFALFYIILLILGEDIVMGNPVLRIIFDKEPCIFITCTILYGLASFTVWLWEKKHPQKIDDPVPQDGGQHPPTS